MSGRLLALVLLVLALLGGVAWFVVRGDGARGAEEAGKPGVEIHADPRTQLSAESPALEARSVEPVEAGSQSSANTSASAGSGTLRLRVLDEATRAPVADLPFLVFRERGGPKELAQGTTDGAGCAELREIEANTVIVRTARRPPYAEQTGAVWLTDGATRELELLLGPGGAFVGRVIDDLQRPVEGAEIRVAGQRDPDPPETRTGADGRFRVECLACRPYSVWIVDGAMRPEHWEEAWVDARRGIMRTGARGIPVPGKDVDLGDLVLDRPSSYAGRLFDANDRLVDGALVGMLRKRELGPADPGFELGPGEVLTGGGGRFELANVPALTRVAVWTREGQRQELPVPPAKPGERVEGLELHLRPETVFELELVDANGAQAVIPAPAKSSAGVVTPWRQSRYWGSDKISVFARSGDGARERHGSEHADPDGRWRVRLAIDPRAVGEFEVSAAGYAPVVERSETGFPALVQRKLVLTPFPNFRVRLVCKESAKPLEGEGEYVAVQICMADPARHAAAGGRCCGLGAYWNERWRGEPLELVLPVRRMAPFWIYIRGPRPGEKGGAFRGFGYVGEMMPSGGLCDLASAGPFEPGPELREFTLDPADFVRQRSGEEVRKPPEPSTPGEERFARLCAHVTDARTGKPIAGAWVTVGGEGANADENGDVKRERLPAGRWQVRVAARGYRPVELGERTTRERETLDLGAIALEPRMRHRGRILDADGAALPRIWLGMVAGGSPANEENAGMQTEPDGSFELIGELPSSFVLQAVSSALHAGWGGQGQRFALEPWPEDVVKELRFARFRKVLVTVAGVDPEEAALVPCACPAPGEPTATCDHRQAHVPPHEQLARGLQIASSEAGTRFAFLLPPGRFVFSGSNLMHELPVTEFEVAPGDTDLELTITAH